MAGKTIRVRVFRFDSGRDDGPSYREYAVPYEKGMSAMNALDYIYQNIDPTLAYYDHAGCSLGICARCSAKVNGKAALLCQTEVCGDIVVEPLNTARVLKDLVLRRGKESLITSRSGKSEGNMKKDAGVLHERN